MTLFHTCCDTLYTVPAKGGGMTLLFLFLFLLLTALLQLQLTEGTLNVNSLITFNSSFYLHTDPQHL